MSKSQTFVINTLLCVFVICVIFLNFFSLGHFLNSDMYGDLWVAKLMWEQKTFFPTNYVFGNQIYLVATPNLAALFYGLTHNMLLSGAVASVTMILLFFQSFYWFMSPLAGKNVIRLSLLVFLCMFIAGIIPENVYAQLFLTGMTFYLCYAITFLLVLGVYVRLLTGRYVSWFWIVFSIILSLIMGMQSARQTCIQVIPLCIFEICLFCYVKLKRKKYNSKTGLFIVVSSIANIAGLLISQLFNVQRDAIYGGLGFSPFTNIKQKLFSTAACFKGLFGLDEVYHSFTDGSVSISLLPQIILSIGLFILIVCASVVLYRKKCVLFRTSAITIITILLLSLSGIFASFYLLEIERLSKYLFVFFILVPVFFAYTFRLAKHKQCFYYGVIVASVLSIVSSYLPAVFKTFTPTVYDEIADYMLDNHKTIIYSTWDYAGPVAGASGCKIQAGRWDASDIFKIKSHTNIMNIYTEENNAVAAYLFDKKTLKEAKVFLGDEFKDVFYDIKRFHENGEEESFWLCFARRQLLK